MHQKPIFERQVLEDFGELRSQAFSGEPRRLVEQLAKRDALQSEHAELGKDLLLPHAKAKRIAGQVWSRLRIRRLLGDKLRRLRVKRYDGDHSSSFATGVVAAHSDL